MASNPKRYSGIHKSGILLPITLPIQALAYLYGYSATRKGSATVLSFSLPFRVMSLQLLKTSAKVSFKVFEGKKKGK